jgi:Uma2 family endonuclease
MILFRLQGTKGPASALREGVLGWLMPKGGTAMALHDPSPKLTYEDYVLMPDDGRRHEIIDGEHYVSPSPSSWHQELSVRLTLYLGIFLREHPLGKLFHAPMDVLLSPQDVVQPDLLFVSAERLGIVRGHVRGTPDLVIEILSESTRRVDLGAKLDLYDRSGVKEYWAVDRLPRAILVYRRHRNAFALAADLRAEAGGILTTPLLPGLEVPLAELFG